MDILIEALEATESYAPDDCRAVMRVAEIDYVCGESCGLCRKKVIEKIESRILPWGLEWPHFEDGTLVEVGDEFDCYGTARMVTGIHFSAASIYLNHDGMAQYYVDGPLSRPSIADSQDKIDSDAMKNMSEYWDCGGRCCDDCPSKIDGKKPYERYVCVTCSDAQMLDLLRRQRNLDAREQ